MQMNLSDVNKIFPNDNIYMILQEAQLKSALLDYIKKNHPDDAEKIDMLSRRFGMHREVGEQFEETGEKQIRAISTRFSGSHSASFHLLIVWYINSTVTFNQTGSVNQPYPIRMYFQYSFNLAASIYHY